MWKRRLAIGILLAIGLPVYGEQESGKPSGNQDKSDPLKNPPALTSGVATCVIKQDGSTIECHYPQANPPSYLNRLSSPENLPNLLLFFVGFAGVGVAICTLKKIERQTKSTEDAAVATQNSATAMFKSVELQEIQFTQWVEIGDWENFTRHLQPTEKQAAIIIRFKVGNTTLHPLTLKVVTTKVLGLVDTFAANKLIPPGDGYLVDVSVAVESEDLAKYRENKYAFGVAIDVIYEGVLKKERPQHFLYMVRCGASGTRCEAAEIRNRQEAETLSSI